MTKSIVIAATGLFAFSLVGLAEEKVDTSKLPPPAQKQGLTYETDIKPIFDKSCVKCHGPKKQKAKLRLDSLEAALKGSKHGKDINPGDSTDSPLVHRVGHLGKMDDWMPPMKHEKENPPLTAEQVGLIRAWIDQGAK